LHLAKQHPVFVGFKLDGSLRRQLESLNGPDQKYLSSEEFTFLTLCRRGDDVYVGKIIEDGLSTDRVDDVRRNVLSIVRRLAPETRLPEVMEILACEFPAAEESTPEMEKPSEEGF
jgi:hypothetical protein